MSARRDREVEQREQDRAEVRRAWALLESDDLRHGRDVLDIIADHGTADDAEAVPR